MALIRAIVYKLACRISHIAIQCNSKIRPKDYQLRVKYCTWFIASSCVESVFMAVCEEDPSDLRNSWKASVLVCSSGAMEGV